MGSELSSGLSEAEQEELEATTAEITVLKTDLVKLTHERMKVPLPAKQHRMKHSHVGSHRSKKM
jgi:hypothetical protein